MDLKELEQEVNAIKQRNKRVELDKKNVDVLNLSTVDVLEFESKQKYTVF